MPKPFFSGLSVAPFAASLLFGTLLFVLNRLAGFESALQAAVYSPSAITPVILARLLLFLAALVGSSIFIARKHGTSIASLSIAVMLCLSILFHVGQVVGVIAPPLLFLSFMAYYLGLKGLKPHEMLAQVGLVNASPLKSALLGIGVYIGVMAISLALGLLIQLAGLNDSQNVALKVASLPAGSLFVAVLIAPFAEELFFRGFLQQRIGIIATSLLFAAGHIAYFSISEIVLAFCISVVLCMCYKWHKNIYAITLTHMLFNLTSVIFITLVH